MRAFCGHDLPFAAHNGVQGNTWTVRERTENTRKKSRQLQNQTAMGCVRQRLCVVRIMAVLQFLCGFGNTIGIA